VGVGLGASWGLYAISSQNAEKSDCASASSCKHAQQAGADYTAAHEDATASTVAFRRGGRLPRRRRGALVHGAVGARHADGGLARRRPRPSAEASSACVRVISSVVAALAALSAASAACGNLLGLEPRRPKTREPEPTAPARSTRDDRRLPPWATRPDPTTDGGAGCRERWALACRSARGTAPPCITRSTSPTSDDAGTHNWQYFEPSSVNTLSRDFQGAAFDGRYVYFVPYASGDRHGGTTCRRVHLVCVVGHLRHDDARPHRSGFNGAVYDGRYGTFVPYHTAAAGYLGLLVRFDTQGTFTGVDAGSSWSTFRPRLACPCPTAELRWPASRAASNDGNFVYLVPYFNGLGARASVVR